MEHPTRTLGTAARWRCLAALLLALNALAQAQDKAPTVPAQTEMQKWIATTDAQWQAAFKREVSEVRETEFGKLKVQYLSALDAAIGKASGAGDLEGAVAFRDEQKRFGDTKVVPERDAAAAGVALKQLRAAIRAQLARLEKDNATRTKALHAKYDQVLAQAQSQLTQRGRLDDALLVKAKRDEVSAAWITPAVGAATESPAAASALPKPAAPVARVPLGTRLGPALAKVEAQDVVLMPFAVGSIVWGDREVQFTEIAKGFEGLQFTQAKAHSGTLRFKVLSDGLVQMACTSRFGEKKASGWESEVTTEKMLQQKAWHRQRGAEFKDKGANDYVWWVFTRSCKAGEEFTIRNEKYIAPILLVN